MQREGPPPSMHGLIVEALMRAARRRSEAAAIVSETRARTAELQRTIATVRQDRATRAAARTRPTFGNGQVDADVSGGAG